VERGFWKAECRCGVETYREPVADDRVRLDSYDPKTAHHAPECQFASVNEEGVLRLA
jgi:hypothetical protein